MSSKKDTANKDTANKDIEHLSVMSFEPTKVQFKINDLDEWRKHNTGHYLHIGSFIKIKDGDEHSIISQIQSFQTIDSTTPNDSTKEESIIITARPLGVLSSDGDVSSFTNGIKNISIPPQGVEMTLAEELKAILSYENSANKFSFGHYTLNQNIPIYLDGDLFFSHHIAIVGTTGSGKSAAVTKILQNVIKHRKKSCENPESKKTALNNSHIIIFDIHGEYAHAFPNARVLTINSKDDNNSSLELTIPYWLLRAEELESLFIESGDNNAYNQIAQFKIAVIENKKKWNPNIKDVDYDMPIYFSINEVFEYIKNKNKESYYTDKKTSKRYFAVQNEETNVEYNPDNFNYLFSAHKFYPTTGNAKNTTLEARVESKMNGFYGEFPRFITRFQSKLNDARLQFLLHEPQNPIKFRDDPSKTFTSLVPIFFGNKINDEEQPPQSNITIIDLSTLPFEIVSIIVSVISRVAFEMSFYQSRIWDKNKTPLMMVYEEAHRYISKNQSSKYRETRKAVERIAKEGRKYGISEMIVTQRPSEISPTVLSQCNNFVIMKLANQDDQNIIQSILPDTDNYFSNSLSSLNRQEALLVGNAMANTVTIKVDDADPLPKSSDVDVYSKWSENWQEMIFSKVIGKMLHLQQNSDKNS